MFKLFKFTALLEGVSLLILLFVAMPLKYIWGDPLAVKYVGMAHGLLFIAYVIFAIMLKDERNWDLKRTAFILLASVVPFGTFYAEKKLF